LGKSNLQQQTLTINSSTGIRDGTNNPVCWQGSTQCSSGNNKFGWYLDLPGSSEQVVFNPIFYQGAFIVDSTVPANNVPTSCTTSSDTGFTYAISVDTGGTFSHAFPNYNDVLAAGVQTDATGSPYIVTTVEGTTNLIYQTVSGTPGSKQINLPPNTKAKRLTWIELR
jgi:type IV pilus assembly protein PilY1